MMNHDQDAYDSYRIIETHNEPFEGTDEPVALDTVSEIYVEEEEKYTYEEALDKIGVGRFQMFLLLICGGGWFLDGCLLSLIPFIIPTLEIQWGLSKTQSGLMAAAISVGMIFGSYFGGILSDKYGRRVIFISTIFFTSILGIANSFAPELISFCIMRALLGCCLGAVVPTDLSVLMEFTPRSHRGMYMVSF
jgi:putative MFS transporter